MEKIKDYKYKIKGIEAECEIRGDTKGHFSQTCLLSKNGEKIGLSELLIGDETDEINLIAWRNPAQMVDKITPGERLIINGVLLKIKPTFALEIKSFSSIIKVTE